MQGVEQVTESAGPPIGTLIRRALMRHCPRCGGPKIFSGWTKLKPACPTCGYKFERESGYWVGAIQVNLAVTESLFILFFLVTLFATMPDVPWQPLLIVALATNLVFPWFFYPYSKTLWVAIDLYFHPKATY
ncbi:MAG: hypothetical protein QOG54_442 [Actinomycetota bacterium]|jgi:uncharacterized protein (DUF983 family)|nr:hypothetical protein [Actinomycetota bacterium]